MERSKNCNRLLGIVRISASLTLISLSLFTGCVCHSLNLALWLALASAGGFLAFSFGLSFLSNWFWDNYCTNYQAISDCDSMPVLPDLDCRKSKY